ncbi:MAG: hypothetical protein IPP71_09675 [Bacteroidetes bacterium]|nr:hypothetical protein [Bacteroidota bacterium]
MPEKALETIYTESETKSEKEPENVAAEPVVNEDAEEINFSEAEKSAFQEKGMQKLSSLKILFSGRK